VILEGLRYTAVQHLQQFVVVDNFRENIGRCRFHGQTRITKAFWVGLIVLCLLRLVWKYGTYAYGRLSGSGGWLGCVETRKYVPTVRTTPR
jgi:hypothetical protein